MGSHMADTALAEGAGSAGGGPEAAAGSSGARVLTADGSPGTGRADRAPSAPPVRRRPVMRYISMALILLAGIVLGFAGYLYGLSGVQESRAQVLGYAQLRTELAAQTAPLGPTAPGSPVAVLDIPSIGVRNMVVVEGTTNGTTATGVDWRAGVTHAGRWCDVFEIRDFKIQRCYVYLAPDYASADTERYPWLRNEADRRAS